MIGHLVELHSWKMRGHLCMNRRQRHVPVGLRSTLLLHVGELLHLVHLRHWWRVLLQILDRQTITKGLLLLLLLVMLLILRRLNRYILLLLLLGLIHATR